MNNLDEAPDDYLQRVNRAIDHVLASLRDPLRLEEVAQVAGFSPFHFHRVFKSLMGETLQAFVKRVRLERALHQMAHDPTLSLTRVAHAVGFSSSSEFSRSFKQRFGVPPSVFDLETWRRERRGELRCAMEGAGSPYRLEALPAGENPDGFRATLIDLPERVVLYRRVFDPFRPGVVADACASFVAWAEERGLAEGQWLGYMWDDPDLVPLKDCRYDVGLVVPEGVAGEDAGLSLFHFPPMRVACIPVRGAIDLEQRALDWMYRTWLPGSGKAPAELPCFEAWIGRPFAHGLEHFELDLHLPVRS